MKEHKHIAKILIIYNKPTLLTVDAVDPNVFTLLIGLEGNFTLTFLLQNDAVIYSVSSVWKAKTDELKDIMSWNDIFTKIGAKVIVHKQHLIERNILLTEIDNGLELSDISDIPNLMDENDVIFIY